MINSDGTRYTAHDRQRRADFVIERSSKGFSNRKIHQQFAKEFGCTAKAAANWRRWATAQMVEDQTLETRRGNYAIALELRHDQIVAYQNELVEIQKEIQRVSGFQEQRDRLTDEIVKTSGKELKEAIAKLNALPDVWLTTRANLIESKTRIRERMCGVMNELAKLQGITGPSDWEAAINALMDRNLLPPELARSIRDRVDAFHSTMTESDPAKPEMLDPDDFDPIDSEA
jgi:hypothetical protein